VTRLDRIDVPGVFWPPGLCLREVSWHWDDLDNSCAVLP
jgi:hypothetical protein